MAVAVALLGGCGQERSRGNSLPPAPPGVAAGCREAADVAAFEVLCPTGWPEASQPRKVRLRLYGSDVAYLLEAQDGFGLRSPVFHVLLGGQQRRFPPGFEGGGKLLRVTTRREAVPVYASAKGGRVVGTEVVSLPTRRVGTTSVRGLRAAILRAPPYPHGGIHGGHTLVMWNEGRHGYLVSTHSDTSPRAARLTAVRIARASRVLTNAD